MCWCCNVGRGPWGETLNAHPGILWGVIEKFLFQELSCKFLIFILFLCFGLRMRSWHTHLLIIVNWFSNVPIWFLSKFCRGRSNETLDAIILWKHFAASVSQRDAIQSSLFKCLHWERKVQYNTIIFIVIFSCYSTTVMISLWFN